MIRVEIRIFEDGTLVGVGESEYDERPVVIGIENAQVGCDFRDYYKEYKEYFGSDYNIMYGGGVV